VLDCEILIDGYEIVRSDRNEMVVVLPVLSDQTCPSMLEKIFPWISKTFSLIFFCPNLNLF